MTELYGFQTFYYNLVVVKIQKGSWYQQHVGAATSKTLTNKQSWTRFRETNIGALLVQKRLVKITAKEFKKRAGAPIKEILPVLMEMERDYLKEEIEWREAKVDRLEGEVKYRKELLRKLKEKMGDA